MCKQYYTNKNYPYFRATSYDEFIAYSKIATPGAMVELAPGVYKVPSPLTADNVYMTLDGRRAVAKDTTCDWPRLAVSPTLKGVKGRPNKPITFCGDPKKTILDGSASGSNGAGMTVQSCSYIRVAGFTLRNALRGLDVQLTNNSVFSDLITARTYHEAIRVRYWSNNNVIQNSRITFTGRGFVGNGEGIYVGTARGQTVDCNHDPDVSSYNVIKGNTFGPNVTSENVDIKEFTEGGKIVDNTFDGSDLRGIHASTSWIDLKGNKYEVSGNVGTGLAVEGAGIKVMQRIAGEGDDNVLKENTCVGLTGTSVCLFVDPRTKGNKVDCSNSLKKSGPKTKLTNVNGVNCS